MDLTELTAALAGALSELAAGLRAYLQRAVTALALIAIGWLISWLLRGATRQVIGRLERLVSRKAPEAASNAERVTREAIGGVVFWAVFILFIAAATEQLGLAVVTTALSGLVGYLLVLDSSEGQVLIPAKTFSESVSVLVEE
jgi:dolichol kinase